MAKSKAASSERLLKQEKIDYILSELPDVILQTQTGYNAVEEILDGVEAFDRTFYRLSVLASLRDDLDSSLSHTGRLILLDEIATATEKFSHNFERQSQESGTSRIINKLYKVTKKYSNFLANRKKLLVLLFQLFQWDYAFCVDFCSRITEKERFNFMDIIEKQIDELIKYSIRPDIQWCFDCKAREDLLSIYEELEIFLVNADEETVNRLKNLVMRYFNEFLK